MRYALIVTAMSASLWRGALTARFACFVFLILSYIASSAVAGDEQRRRIYFLESLAPTQFAAVRTIEAFQRRLSEKTTEKFEIFADYMELGRFPSQAHIDRTVQFLAGKYKEAPPDLLIPLGRAAIPFMVKYRDALAPQVPLIITSVPTSAAAEAKTITKAVAVVTEYNFSRTLDLARALQPKTRDLVFVAGASEYDRSWVNDARRELESYRDRYNVRYLVGLPYNEMLREVSQLSPDTIVIVSFVFVDGAGVPRVPPDVAAAIADISPAPTYSPVSTFFGRGIVGGYMDSFEAHGIAAADLAFEILSGKPLVALPQETRPLHQYEVDDRQLKRWALSGSLLPAGSVVHFRDLSAWARYRWQIILVSIALVVQSLLIAGLFFEHRRRRQAEIEGRLRMRQLAHMNRSIVAGELSATIAHEINQPLAAIVTSGNAAMRWLTNKTPNIEKAVDSLKRIVTNGHRASSVIETVRAMFKKDIAERKPADISDLIRDVLVLMRIELEERHVQVNSVLTSGLPQVSVDRIQLQQVMLNLARNAIEAMSLVTDRPAILRVRSEATADEVIISIENSGPGIDPGNIDRIFEPFFTTKPDGMGMGLSICRSIVEAHGGRLSASPGRLYGLIFELVLPLPR